MPDGIWARGSTGTLVNRSRHYDGTPSWALVSTSSIDQGALVAPDAEHGTSFPDGVSVFRQRVELVSGPGYGGTALGVDVVVGLPANRPPSIEVKDPIVVAVGSGATITATASDPDVSDALSVTWDLDDDGTVDRTGTSVTLSAAELDDLVCGGACAPGDEQDIRVRVTDRGGLSAEVTSTIRISGQASFAFEAHPRLMQVNPGATGHGHVEVKGIDGFDQQVDLAFEDVPDGWTATIPSAVAGPGEAAFSIRPPADVADDRFDLTLVATSETQVERRTITVATPFALIPRCEAVVAGTVRDAVTGEPLTLTTVFSGGATVYPGETGTYRIVHQLPVGYTSHVISVSANRSGYYQPPAVSARLACGDEVALDLALAPHDLGTAKIRVVEAIASPVGVGAAVTDTPVAGATMRWTVGVVTREVVTGPDGRAELPDLPIASQSAVRYVTVHVSKPGYHQQQVTVPYGPDLVADLGTLGLLAECSVTISPGRVVDEHGEPWVGAVVTRTGVPTVLTDADGGYPGLVQELRYPNRLLSLSIGARAPINGAPTVWEVVPPVHCGTSSEPITIVLPRPVELEKHHATITGVVVDEETGEPLPDVQVTMTTRRSSTVRAVTTGADGTFRFADVEVGEGQVSQTDVWLGTARYGYYGWNTGIMPFFTVGAGEAPHRELEMLRVRTSTVEGHVYDLETGEPLAGFPLNVSPALTTARRTDDVGFYQHRNLTLGHRNARTAAQVRSSLVTHEGKTYFASTSAPMSLGPDEVITHDLHLTPRCFGSRVSGTVVDATDLSPIEGVRVEVPNGAMSLTDADGRFTLNQVLAGSFNASRTTTVTASKAGYGSTSRQITVYCDGDITIDFGQPSGGLRGDRRPGDRRDRRSDARRRGRGRLR